MKKLVVITGASSGIGEATAKLLSSQGHPLLLLARRVERMEALKLPNTICRKVDILDVKTFQQAIKEAEEKFGEVDCLVNNAGVMLLGDSTTQDLSEWNQMIDVNVKGLLNGIHLVLNKMVKNNTGTIINISSVAGRKTFSDHAIYCGTKFAVHSISDAIRKEVAASNVRVSIIAPGVVETELLSHTTDKGIVDGYKEWKDSMGEALTAENIANAVDYIYHSPQSVCVREVLIAPTKQPD